MNRKFGSYGSDSIDQMQTKNEQISIDTHTKKSPLRKLGEKIRHTLYTK